MLSHRTSKTLTGMTLTGMTLAGVTALLCGCAAKPPKSDPEELAYYRQRNDPFEPTNRVFYRVNNTLDQNLLRPVAVAYRDTVPDPVRTHLHDVLSNLGNPAQLANDMLEGKPRKAGNTFMRLLINTTVGVGGVFDVASSLGYPDHDNDFGLTLALWGVPSGPFLFLPVLGPNDFRDAIGYGANSALDPFTWVSFGGSATFGWARFGAGAVVSRSQVLQETDSIQKTALDPYATYRSLYQQHRQSAVELGRKDLPATVPSWYSNAGPRRQGTPTRAQPPSPAPRLAPSPSLTP